MKQLHYLIHRAIDINGLIGNIGGYIGLCLGYSLLQIPNFIMRLTLKCKKCGSKRQPTRRNMLAEENDDDVRSIKGAHIKLLKRITRLEVSSIYSKRLLRTNK